MFCVETTLMFIRATERKRVNNNNKSKMFTSDHGGVEGGSTARSSNALKGG